MVRVLSLIRLPPKLNLTAFLPVNPLFHSFAVLGHILDSACQTTTTMG